MKDKVYLLDTNIFIEPYRTFYSLDYGTAFWDFLKYQAKNDQIFSIDKVYTEQGKRGIFKDEAIKEFKKEDNADPWLVAYAMHYRDRKSVFKKEIVIVTQEKLDRNRKNKIPIPIVCEEFSVECCDLFTMLRELGFKIRFDIGF